MENYLPWCGEKIAQVGGDASCKRWVVVAGTATRTNTDEHGRTRTLGTPLRGGNRGKNETFFGRSRALTGEQRAAADKRQKRVKRAFFGSKPLKIRRKQAFWGVLGGKTGQNGWEWGGWGLGEGSWATAELGGSVIDEVEGGE